MHRSLTLAALMFTLSACGGGAESTTLSPESPEVREEAICTGDAWACACAVHTTREACNASQRCYWTGPSIAAGTTEALSLNYCKPTYEVREVEAESFVH
ncbi:hypothetical protein LZ198_15185 [Myxococcus sp. K15C18031901]|uniref:hypothetical protein n=1 Tax=Myxococcus dinghuensis TaxID=2906761 RepID=UPI0020A6E5C7|nr:hypothetical protein [Myxococcus dinghuensis]MCP3100215.1 hypothetical protein [Myxococcus dinghuensis]